MRKKKPCPKCGSLKIEIVQTSVRSWHVECRRCGYKGPRMPNDIAAMDAWARVAR